MPSTDSSGVREAPLPVVPGCERMSVRVTLLSYLAGLPYSPIPAPGAFIDDGTSGGSTASACRGAPAARPLAVRKPTVRLMKLRLDSSMAGLLLAIPVRRPIDRVCRGASLSSLSGVARSMTSRVIRALDGRHDVSEQGPCQVAGDSWLTNSSSEPVMKYDPLHGGPPGSEVGNWSPSDVEPS